MQCHLIRNSILTAIFGLALQSPIAVADSLDLSCATTDGSRTFGLTVDLSTGLVSNQGSNSGRRWAGRVTDGNVTWDEVYDERRGRIAEHFVLERPTGALHGTDIAGGSSGRDILNAVCKKPL